jgi:hypothetical protein
MKVFSNVMAAAAATLILASPGFGDVLWDNGPLVNFPGGGFGGADASRLMNTTLGENTLGYGHQTTFDNAVGDDFTVTDAAGWHIDSITFYAYQTGGPMNGDVEVSADVLDAFPAGPVVGTDVGGPGVFSGIYRDSETSPGADNRAIQAITVVIDADFAAGQHWLVWQAIGSASSGPWAPPVTYADVVNAPNPLGQAPNGLQSVDAGLTWLPVEDSGSLTPDEFPFIINGSIIPTPGALALLGLAGLAGRRRRR